MPHKNEPIYILHLDRITMMDVVELIYGASLRILLERDAEESGTEIMWRLVKTS